MWLLLLIVTIHTTLKAVTSSKSCIENVGDISNIQLDKGKWIQETYEYLHFSRSSDVEALFHDACPAEMAIFTCYRHDKAELHGKGFEAENKKYKMDYCDLQSFTPTLFLNLVRGRKLVICCDSVQMQFFTNLVCSLHSTTTAVYDLHWALLHQFGSTDCPSDRNGKNCHLLHSRVYYPEFDFEIFLAVTHMEANSHVHGTSGFTIDDFVKDYNLRPRHDIVLLNYGVHVDEANLKTTLTNLAVQYAASRNNLPIFIWREMATQHFDSPNGYWTNIQKGLCVPFKDLDGYYLRESKLHIANEILGKYKIPILRIYNATRTQWMDHIGPQVRTDEPGRMDCTHYCQPSGVISFWRELLFNALIPIVSTGYNFSNSSS